MQAPCTCRSSVKIACRVKLRHEDDDHLFLGIDGESALQPLWGQSNRLGLAGGQGLGESHRVKPKKTEQNRNGFPVLPGPRLRRMVPLWSRI